MIWRTVVQIDEALYGMTGVFASHLCCDRFTRNNCLLKDGSAERPEGKLHHQEVTYPEGHIPYQLEPIARIVRADLGSRVEEFAIEHHKEADLAPQRTQ